VQAADVVEHGDELNFIQSQATILPLVAHSSR
jgi:hypothetical protein